MNKILIVGNWKMYLNVSQADTLVHRLQENIKINPDIDVVLAPSMLALQPLSLRLDKRKFKLAAQNAYFRDEGAFTGEVSFAMLRGLVHYVIVGHSERRHIFGEDLDIVREKVAAAIRCGISPILCVGESKTERDDGETNQVLHDQLMTGLSDLTAKEVRKVIIAYEPVWAIGTGEVAKPAQVEKAVSYIRKYIEDVFDEKTAQAAVILYGGSVTPEVIKGFLDIPGVNGFLVGGASVNYQSFVKIVESANRWQREKQA